jgi:hypothetical protein
MLEIRIFNLTYAVGHALGKRQFPAKPEATYRCPTGAIQWVTGGQFSTKKPLPEAQSEKRYQSIQV